MEQCKTITVGVIAYNEHKYLPSLLSNILEQTYKKELMEIILVDSCSSDDTRKIMQQFEEKNKAFFNRIIVLDNLAKNQPSGWNVVIDNATSDVILRLDAHAKIPADFVERNMERINFGEYVCGGPRINIIDESTAWKNMLLDAEQSLFGSGIASYRQGTNEKKYVKSVFHGAYRKEVFDSVGLFNKNLLRTEDNEIHYRITKAGYKICYDPHIKSYYQTRNSLKGMLKQKFGNGFWIGRTLFICPGCISLFHMVPFAFVVAIICSIVIGISYSWWMLYLIAIAYSLFLIMNTLGCLLKSRNLTDLFLPVVYFLMHSVYGIGTLCGIISSVHKRTS